MTGGLLLRLDEITQHQPSMIFLMIGINDLGVNSKGKILENYELIVKNIKEHSPSTKLNLQSILPVNNTVRKSGKTNRDVVFLNEKILEIAKKYGLDFFNLHPFFLDENGNLDKRFTQDGIHLDAEGYLIWKKELQKYIDS